MRRIPLVPLAVCILMVPGAHTAWAQAPGRVGVGVAVGLVNPPDEALDAAAGVGLTARLRVREGWAPSIGFSWHQSDLSPADTGSLGRLRVRPIMLGVSYTFVHDRLSVSPSALAGYAFNRLRPLPGVQAEVSNAPAFRLGVSSWYEVTSRVGLNVFAGYLVNRPELRRLGPGPATTRDLRADALLFSVGVAAWIF